MNLYSNTATGQLHGPEVVSGEHGLRVRNLPESVARASKLPNSVCCWAGSCTLQPSRSTAVTSQQQVCGTPTGKDGVVDAVVTILIGCTIPSRQYQSRDSRRSRVVNVAVVVAVAGVISPSARTTSTDHHRSFRLGARLDHGKACSSGAIRAFAPLGAGLGSPPASLARLGSG